MSRTSVFLKLLAGLAAGVCLCLPHGAYAGDGASVVRVDLGAGASAQTLALPQGRSAVVELPIDARDVLVSNPAVAEAVLRTPRRIYVLGMKSGVTDAVFFDAAGRRILTLSVRVDQNTSALSDTINRVLPGSHVKVEAMDDSIILSGMVMNASDADKALQIAKATVSSPSQVLNMISVAGKDQVMLKVRIVEMEREVIKQLGFNWSAVIGQSGSAQFLLGTAASYGINGTLLGGLTSGFSQDTTLQPESKIASANPVLNGLPIVCKVCTNGGQGTISTLQPTAGSTGLNKAMGNIQAFERVGLTRTLAEPNLTAVSGESAKFLVGGEFPVPTGEDNTGHVSIEFKPYGVGLGFTPVVLSGGRISLKLSTEVSELSNQGSFSLSTGSGSPSLVVPALTVRRAETMVELPSGGSMMIAGLLQDKSAQDIDSIPGVKDLPILGALFRSRDYLAGQTELVIIITPYIVDSTSPANLQTPADGAEIASDADTILLGRLNKTYKRAPEATAEEPIKDLMAMSSSDLRLTRERFTMRAPAIPLLLSLLLLGACATKDHGPGNPDRLLPTERYSIDVTPAPEELRLAPHATGLSAAQVAALGAYARQWMSVSGGEITLKAPDHGDDPAAAYRTAAAARDYLISEGVAARQVNIVGYDAGDDQHAPIVLSYVHDHATARDCGRQWEDLAKVDDNREYANFGCAVTANIAAQVANPADLVNPRATDVADAQRRQTVVEKYRQGVLTSTPADPQADGTFSEVGH